MTKYVKSDIVDRPYFTAGKAYEVINVLDQSYPEVVDDDGCRRIIATDNPQGIKSASLDFKDTWKWCDKEGNEL